MGSESDLEIMQESAHLFDEFEIGYEITIVSAHRTPDRLIDFAKNAQKNGFKIIIAAAGGAAHLPGMTAANTNLPVIGVPIKTKSTDGLDSLLSIVQMPAGVPVATVAVNGAKNAAILALQILAISSPMLYNRLDNWRKTLETSVVSQAQELEESGLIKYLSAKKMAK